MESRVAIYASLWKTYVLDRKCTREIKKPGNPGSNKNRFPVTAKTVSLFFAFELAVFCRRKIMKRVSILSAVNSTYGHCSN